MCIHVPSFNQRSSILTYADMSNFPKVTTEEEMNLCLCCKQTPLWLHLALLCSSLKFRLRSLKEWTCTRYWKHYFFFLLFSMKKIQAQQCIMLQCYRRREQEDLSIPPCLVPHLHHIGTHAVRVIYPKQEVVIGIRVYILCVKLKARGPHPARHTIIFGPRDHFI